MDNEKSRKYIKEINESYLKILSEDVETEVKERKRLSGIEKDKIEEAYERMLKEETYQEFFNKKLKEYGVSSPDELEDEKKKEFFNMIDKEWKGEKEED